MCKKWKKLLKNSIFNIFQYNKIRIMFYFLLYKLYKWIELNQYYINLFHCLIKIFSLLKLQKKNNRYTKICVTFYNNVYKYYYLNIKCISIYKITKNDIIKKIFVFLFLIIIIT